MKVTFESIGNFDTTIDWLNKAADASPAVALERIGNQGVMALRANTPVGSTGKTAMGWSYKVEIGRGQSEVTFMNNAHPHTNVNVAKLIDSGHGTGTGGYVPPRPYIKAAMNGVFKNASDLIVKELTE